MIKNNLAVLMAERELKIADVYKETGISKTTLMALSENKGKGIQFETIDKLCNFLNVSPKEFFVYSPFLVEYIPDDDKLFLRLTSGEKINNFYFEFSSFTDDQMDLDMRMDYLANPSKKYDFYFVVSIEESRTELEKIYSNLNIMFKRELVNNILDRSIELLVRDKKIENATCNLCLIINDLRFYREIEIQNGKVK